jgi:hypothetical protein
MNKRPPAAGVPAPRVQFVERTSGGHGHSVLRPPQKKQKTKKQALIKDVVSFSLMDAMYCTFLESSGVVYDYVIG